MYLANSVVDMGFTRPLISMVGYGGHRIQNAAMIRPSLYKLLVSSLP